MGGENVALKPQHMRGPPVELTDDFERVALDRIVVPRERRQRRELYDSKGEFINDDGLLESVALRGVMSPVLVRRENMELVYGERRYTAARLASHTDIPVRYVEDLDSTEALVIELEENIRRKALPWRDECRAVAALHGYYVEEERAKGNIVNGKVRWSDDATGKRLGYGQAPIAIRVARELDSPRIASAESVRAAFNILARQDERRTADLVSDIIDGTQSIFASVPAPGAAPGAAEPVPLHIPPPTAPESILCADFIQWAREYSGPTFNLLHCDFPYGIGVFDGPQSGRDSYHTYDDSDETYWALIEALATNLDRLCAHSAHLMFWCSADVQRLVATIEAFRRLAPSLIFDTFPLVWHKTDNMGILPDPKRGPRRVYETALVASREDRWVVKSVSNAYGAPTDKTHHPSTKPEPVLRHFLSMYVDEHTRLLDPACGSGSALRAAESLGAAYVLGLERDTQHAEAARTALRQFRTLRKASR
jgi:ParB/RepB/Spo0J family partition protein